MDVVADPWADGRRVRALTVMDTCPRECVAIDIGQGLGGHGRKRRGGRHHGIADASELLDEGGDGLARIDQLLPLADAAVRIDFNNSDFGDPIFAGGGAGGFQVDKG